MLVMKFGGTSVTHPQSVAAIYQLVTNELSRKPILVVSALSGITDLLVRLSGAKEDDHSRLLTLILNKHSQWILNIFIKPHEQIIATAKIEKYLSELGQTLLHRSNLDPLQFYDMVVAYGELMSSYLLSYYLITHGVAAEAVSAAECVVTNQQFGGTDFIPEKTQTKVQQRLLPLLNANIVPVITGFIAASETGEITNLGRGGSDYSAAILGFALNTCLVNDTEIDLSAKLLPYHNLVEEIQIWTDVNGVYSADPRVIKEAKLLPQLSYQEASELAMFGAKVLHPRTLKPAITSNIPVRVVNTFNLKSEGTLIGKTTNTTDGLVKAITWKNSVPLINIYSPEMLLSKGFLQKVFTILAQNNISVNMLSASEVSVSLTLDNTGKLDAALVELNQLATAEYLPGYGTVSLVGEQIMNTQGVMQAIFDIFEETATPVEMLSYSVSNINISMIIPSDKIGKVIPILHDKFIDR